ncbi:MAG TPA: dihydrofolate reductase family protein [Thermoanaerobaculia bacterium]|jgi:dihydrofolate reductase|nr:dihydrofolate reductase family protein [Thermoanaerobaculia bacterium]
MRKLKLQMQITVDGFVAGPEGQLDWMTWEMDDKAIAFVNELIDSSETILMGRKMTPGFVSYWESVKSDDPQYDFAQKMVNTPKVVFSRTLSSLEGKNVRVENRDLVTAVNELKSRSGKDLLVYGGASFVASLIEHHLIDELHLVVNPIAIHEGMRVFTARTPLQLVDSVALKTGKVVTTYKPRV